MTLDQITGEIESRGLSIVLLPSGQLALRGDRDQVTRPLLAALRWHKAAITLELSSRREREWVIPTGTYRCRPWREDWHPIGAIRWRYVGEEKWRKVGEK